VIIALYISTFTIPYHFTNLPLDCLSSSLLARGHDDVGGAIFWAIRTPPMTVFRHLPSDVGASLARDHVTAGHAH